ECNNTYIDTVRIYKAEGGVFTLYADTMNSPIATIDDSTLNDNGWIDIPVRRTLSKLILVIEPVTVAQIAHVELWGLQNQLSGIYTQYRFADADAVHNTCGTAIDVYDATIEDNETVEGKVTVPNPWQYRRVYIQMLAGGVFRPVSVAVKVNECDWLGGLTIPEEAGIGDDVREHTIEVNPQWFVPGQNSVYIQTRGGTVTVKKLRVIAVKDTGFNELQRNDKALYDGNTATYETVGNEGAIVTGDRKMRIYGALVYMHEGAVTLQAQTERGWVNIAGVVAKESGWYYSACEKAIVTDTLRVVAAQDKAVTVGEVALCASPAEEQVPEIVISYPRNGEYFGRTAHIEGFVHPYATQDGVAGLTVNGRELTCGIAGGFTAAISKNMVGLGQEDDSKPWQLTFVAEYGRSGVQAVERVYSSSTIRKVQTTLVLDDGFMPYTQGSGGGITSPAPVSYPGSDVPSGTGLTVTVAPDSAKSVYYQGVQLEIPKGAVDETVTVTIIPLGEHELAPLTPGMRNVTAPAAGYRFLFNGKPHGSFKKAITISIPYDSGKLLSGTSEKQIQMYYYDDGAAVWKRMEGSSAVTKKDTDYSLYARSVISSTGASGVVVAKSTHFTDFINATLTVPEHPEALLFNPNSIKDIKAGDPVSGMQLIQPPQVSNTGDAGIRFPITIPKGRAGMQPQLELTYSQQGGSGPLGLGWNMRISSISIDTKWGAARYDGTDVYSLDGSQLVPVDNGGNYRTRIEGGFAKIYYDKQSNCWTVTHKNGVRYIYGE
ncbi:MAG TPA: SpvB/TcaC N-terminal domain-containing protein, partial [Spirochaetota bacterium]|nr:SpvB/TcaC N-terminal domain-containing protein [Spirochaetota bacterium]